MTVSERPVSRLVLHWLVDEDVDATGLPARAWSRQVILDALRAPSSRIEPGSTLEMSVRLLDDETIRALNRDYRHKDRATNVLSFPADPLPETLGRKRDYLGDLALALPYVRREAAAQGKPLRAHWAHLLTHGTLHLLGYDHIEEADAVLMEGLERRILADRGVADPYFEMETHE